MFDHRENVFKQKKTNLNLNLDEAKFFITCDTVLHTQLRRKNQFGQLKHLNDLMLVFFWERKRY